MVAAHRLAVFLGHAGDGGHLLRDLGGSRALLAQRVGNLCHGEQHLIGRLADAAHGFAGALGPGDALVDLGHALLHALHRPFGAFLNGRDHLCDLLGGVGGAFGQLAHLIGHHGETSALVAGTGSFDRRIERQQVGLRGDVADHPDDGGNLPGALAQLGDGTRRITHRDGDLADLLDHCGDDLAALARQLAGTMGQRVGLAGIARNTLDADRHLLHRRGHARCRIALALGCHMNLPRGGRQAARRVGDVIGIVLDAADQPAHGLGHVVEAAGHVAQFIACSQVDVCREIPCGESFTAFAQTADAGHYRQVGAHRQVADHRQHHQQHGEVAVQHLPGVIDALLQQLIQVRQQHVVHLRVGNADRLGGHVEELRG